MKQGKTRRVGARFSVSALAAALLAMSVTASAQQPGSPNAEPAVIDRNAVRTLCTLTRREIAKLKKVSVEDAEAQIVFALSQANARREIVDPALICAGVGVTDANILQAIDNVRRAYRTSGTAAIQRSGGANGGVTLFSPPVVGIGGGGGSNYTPR